MLETTGKRVCYDYNVIKNRRAAIVDNTVMRTECRVFRRNLRRRSYAQICANINTCGMPHFITTIVNVRVNASKLKCNVLYGSNCRGFRDRTLHAFRKLFMKTYPKRY